MTNITHPTPREIHEHGERRRKLGVFGLHPSPEALDRPFHCPCGVSFVPALVGIRRSDYGDAIIYESHCPGCHSTHSIHVEQVTPDPVADVCESAFGDRFRDLDSRLPKLGGAGA